MDENVLISVIITTFNRVHAIPNALESIFRQETSGKFSIEIIVIDNASTDGTRACVERIASSSPVKVNYYLEEKAGVAFARNRGIRESKGDWIAFFDDDQIAEPNWLQELYAIASSKKTYCVGGHTILSLPTQENRRLSSICRNLLGEKSHGTEITKYLGKELPGTGNCLVHKKLFSELGMFDPLFAQGCEDSDYFRRIRNAGYEIWYSPGAVVHHVIPPYRLENKYLYWISTRLGSNFALIDHKEKGTAKLVFNCIARIGQSLLVHCPLLLWAYLISDHPSALGLRCRIKRTYGYTFETVSLFAPIWLRAEDFHKTNELRKEREIF